MTSAIVLGNSGSLGKSGYAFYCWNREADGGGYDYFEGDELVLLGDTTIFAKWDWVISTIAGTGTAGF